VLEDWLWHVISPSLLYVLLVAAAILLWYWPAIALYMIATVLLGLLFIGIHNAWDVAASISLRPVDETPKPEQKSPAPPVES
jgi:Co/Zn/Cd efflux system component